MQAKLGEQQQGDASQPAEPHDECLALRVPQRQAGHVADGSQQEQRGQPCPVGLAGLGSRFQPCPLGADDAGVRLWLARSSAAFSLRTSNDGVQGRCCQAKDNKRSEQQAAAKAQ